MSSPNILIDSRIVAISMVIIDTTKPVKSGSKCSGMYQTVSKDKFKRGIANERFLEWKLDKHFSGVTHQNVMKAADAGLTRLLLLKPEVFA